MIFLICFCAVQLTIKLVSIVSRGTILYMNMIHAPLWFKKNIDLRMGIRLSFYLGTGLY